MAGSFTDADATHEGPELDRKIYFRELLRLQGELVKLQDWVEHSKQKVVVLFKAAISAGKGGVIKRYYSSGSIRRYLPRRAGAAGAERTRADPVVFPALCHASAGRR